MAACCYRRYRGSDCMLKRPDELAFLPFRKKCARFLTSSGNNGKTSRLKVRYASYIWTCLRFTISSPFAPDNIYMDNHQVQFMVDFTMPHDLPEDFVSRIPQQRALVNRLLSEGKILNYALSLENSKLWVVFSVQSESDPSPPATTD